MKNRIFILCLLTMLAGAAFAQAPKPFVITHIVYPDLEDYTALIESIYTELGFQVTLIPTPSLRGLILLNDGLVDADVIRVGTVAEEYANVLVVQPVLKQAVLNLICVKGIPCNRDILKDEKLNILASERIIEMLKPGEFNAHMVSNELIANIPDMLRAQRYFYAFFTMDELMSQNFQQEFQVIKIMDLSVHHIIQKKHADLLPLIEQKLREKLPELNRKRASQ